MPVFVKGYARVGKQVSGYVKASGPHSLLRGMADMRPRGVRVGGKALTRSEVRGRAKAALARARQIQTVRSEAIDKRPKLY
jgi:hypothetical protein